MAVPLHHWPSRIEGERTSIAAVRAEEIVADWLDEAAQAVAGRGTPCRLQERLDDGDSAFWIYPAEGASQAVGALSGRLADIGGAQVLVWTWLAVAADWRHYGYGGASVPLFERAASELGAESALAPLPPDNGVALYFWLRLGYVPLREPELLPSEPPTGVARDAIWMHRSLGSPERR